MENLNAEQIKNVLEHCANWTAETGCKGCPYEDNCINEDVIKAALALITSQEQRIKELTEENERLRAIPEQLHKEMSERMVEERKIERKLAVRKMSERLDKRFCHDPAFLGVEQRLIMDVIDQIAKEMLEGEK